MSKMGSDEMTLEEREEAYRKLNDDLEKKTANIIQETDDMLKKQEALLVDNKLFDEHFLKESVGKNSEINYDNSYTTKMMDLLSLDTGTMEKPAVSKSKSSRPNSLRNGHPPTSSNRIKNNRSQSINDNDIFDEDILPPTATNMGTESQIRFLKAKILVLRNELNKIRSTSLQTHENTAKSAAIIKELKSDKDKFEQKLKVKTIEIERLTKINQNYQNSEKELEIKFNILKKDLENLKKDQRKKEQDSGSTEIRLKRTLEELAKCKERIKMNSNDKHDTMNEDRNQISELKQQNLKLENKKNELLQIFKKQQKLIDILNRQKMLLETSKVIQFTEDEFLKTLEWNISR
ncbi:hypothetical protein SNEBB_009899 [Seison nebaliae]|nr:hypothetical protein SNEBB_009899 [Seison nebaliae]